MAFASATGGPMIVIKCYFTIFTIFFFLILNIFVVPYNVLRGSCARSFLFFSPCLILVVDTLQ